MTKEAPNSPYNKLVFREPFNDEATVRKNGGTPTNVTFENGVGSFNGKSSKINYNFNLNGTYSVRIKVKNLAYTEAYASLIDFRNSTGTDTVGYVYTGSAYGTKSLKVNSGTIYVNGVISSTYTGVNDEIVVTGMTVVSIRALIGVSKNFTTYFTSGFYDLVEIYEGTLTASEVANLYNNTWNKELSPNKLLLDFNSTNGVLDLGDYTNTATATNVTVNKNGALFNGITSNIDTGTDMIGTKAVTVMGWFKAKDWGSDYNGWGGLLWNGKFLIHIGKNAYNNLLIARSNLIAATAKSANNSISLDKWIFYAVTVDYSGLANFYIGDKVTSPAISGTTNQNSGTRTAGTDNVFIGKSSYASGWDGFIATSKVYEGILSLQDITREWSSSRSSIQ
ncbi:MAG: hypothetical protein PHN69_08225 [Candidatus Pacebacteria bacterium]|nr:hypothetical protein [Candidatus Paceibacterota bacterium]